MSSLRIPSLLLCLVMALGLVACGESSESSAPEISDTAEANLPEVSVDEAASLIEAGSATAVDANSTNTRSSHGILPGATLLTSSSRYDASAELPADHAGTLVFYCANEDCCASDTAAQRAVEAGFEDVRVMRAGIMGWEAAGKTTQPLS